MREIKFRAWNKKEKKMYIHTKWIYTHFYNCMLNDSFVLMQYTGLKDKNGIEIYEGDILKFANKSFFGGEIGVVEFNNGSFRMKNENFSSLFPKERSIKKYIKVIGNIYENKELLNVQ